ncbi:YdeI/OmpD-associated family protein [Gryllotalpicola koreensis]|uniref:YdeI/OmpD-associated family protein n=1 Tax=Gryllotalpicola koreensis TaxID=993086 RepID=A0ABP7ZPV7_9MICO
MAEELPELLVPDADAWRAWLAANHATSPGVLLVLTKKGGTVTALGIDDAIDQALCFGWVDGRIGRRDDASYLTRFTPRRAKSRWSKLNVDRVERLTAEGLMAPAGEAAVAAAQASGLWEAAYAGQASVTVPQDLLDAVRAQPEAQAMFDVLTSANRYALIYRLDAAASPQARERKLAEFVAMLARHETPHPQHRMPS